MRNYKTQSEYNLHSSGLRVLRNRAGVLFSTLPKGHAIVSDVNGGEFYGIESGKYYPTKLLLRLNRLIQTEGKYDWIQWHSTYDGLDYHVSQVCSKDYRWVNGIDSLPEKATVTLDPVIIEDPEITGRQTATIETLDENGEWGNKVTLNEEQYKHELKSQADDENRHLGDGSIFSG